MRRSTPSVAAGASRSARALRRRSPTGSRPDARTRPARRSGRRLQGVPLQSPRQRHALRASGLVMRAEVCDQATGHAGGECQRVPALSGTAGDSGERLPPPHRRCRKLRSGASLSGGRNQAPARTVRPRPHTRPGRRAARCRRWHRVVRPRRAQPAPIPCLDGLQGRRHRSRGRAPAVALISAASALLARAAPINRLASRSARARAIREESRRCRLPARRARQSWSPIVSMNPDRTMAAAACGIDSSPGSETKS